MLKLQARSADDLLLVEIEKGNTGGIERCLKAGATINGSAHNGEDYPPVVYAAARGNARMVTFLLERGANVDAVVWRECDLPRYSRAIHAAVSSGNAGAFDTLRTLLKAGANVNAKNAQGCTALMMVYRVDKDVAQRVKMARELLSAGADINLQDVDGRVALHYAAYCGNTDLIDLLLSEQSLSTLNHVTEDGKTPLLVAVEFNHCSAVARLVSAGASQRAILDTDDYMCPFKNTVKSRNEDMMKVFLTDKGLKAVGGVPRVLPNALSCVVERGAAKILKLLLMAEGEGRKAFWANHHLVSSMSILFLAAAYGVRSNVEVLLAAGAIETETDCEGYLPREVIGQLKRDGDLDARVAAAIDRALQRGPAYRARSLLWPSKKAGTGRTAELLGVQIFRPRSRKFFSGTFGRCEIAVQEVGVPSAFG